MKGNEKRLGKTLALEFYRVWACQVEKPSPLVELKALAAGRYILSAHLDLAASPVPLPGLMRIKQQVGVSIRHIQEREFDVELVLDELANELLDSLDIEILEPLVRVEHQSDPLASLPLVALADM